MSVAGGVRRLYCATALVAVGYSSATPHVYPEGSHAQLRGQRGPLPQRQSREYRVLRFPRMVRVELLLSAAIFLVLPISRLRMR